MGSEWKNGKLGDHVQIILGGTPRTNEPSYWKGNIPWISVVDFSKDKTIFKTEKTITKEGLKKSNTKLLGIGDVVISARGTVGKIIVCGIPMAFNQSCYALRTKSEELLQNCLYYLIRYNVSYLKKKAIGGVFDTIVMDTLKDLDIILPPLSTQNKIATFLSNYDDLIENNEKRIKILENITKLLYEEWFVRFKFPGHEKVKIIDSGTEFRMIPEGWEVKSIMNYENFQFINTNIKKFNGEKEYFATANVSGLDILKEGEIVNWSNKPSRAQKEPIINSVWFARMKDSYKVLGITKTKERIALNSILSSGFAGFKCEEGIFPFLFLNINSKRFEELKNLYATGATQVSINNDGIKNIDIISPPKDIVEYFGELINPLLNKLFLLQIKNQNLKKTRDLLLPKLISGEIDVSDLDIQLNRVLEQNG